MLCLLGAVNLFAVGQPSPPQGSLGKGQKAIGERKYSLIVHESNADSINKFNDKLIKYRGNRGFVSDVASLYRSTFAGQIITATTGLLETGITAIVNARKDKRPDWETAIRGESQFVRVLPMQTDILDFYKAPSQVGPLDPTDMFFHGFGCRQVIEYKVNDSTTVEKEVFYVSCKVRTDEEGLARMLNHSKFEVYVDSLRFNPYLCDLPNDSLGMDTDKRIGFSFEKRQDLKFNLHATITSSWINQAMQVYNDVTLGEFDIVANIDPKKLDADNYFVYSSAQDKEPGNLVSVTGDCFLVPRSYVGTSDMKNTVDSWGTGQYKVDMKVSESCQINPRYYKDKSGGWDKDKWSPEWKLIKQRKPGNSFWQQTLKILGTGYVGTSWITTLADPIKTYVIQTEQGLLNCASTAMPTTASAQGQLAGQGAQAGQGGMPQGK
jgi:hypothetical protein